MFIDLILDLIRRIAHEDTRVRVGRAHFRLRALERREELGVDQGRFGVFELDGDVAGETEVRVLVDCAGNEARDVGLRAEDLEEGVGEGGCGLNCGEVDLADVVAGKWR